MGRFSCCGEDFIKYTPSKMFCWNPTCRKQITRLVVYYSCESKELDLKVTICRSCYNTKQHSTDKFELMFNVSVIKSDLKKFKNDSTEYVTEVQCIQCKKLFHAALDVKFLDACIMFINDYWQNGYQCLDCSPDDSRHNPQMLHLADKLKTTKLEVYLEQRIMQYLAKQTLSDTDSELCRNLYIKVVQSVYCEFNVQKQIKQLYGTFLPDSCRYRRRMFLLFQKNDNADVALFACYAQEYDDKCVGANRSRVMIAYLDSVKFFEPPNHRRNIYFELIIGYLEYMKGLGYEHAYIWINAPQRGIDYIFYNHPKEQHIPTQTQLEKWYDTLLDYGKRAGVLKKVQNIEEEILSDYKIGDEIYKLPYMDGDHWPDTIEEILTNIKEEKPLITKEEMIHALSTQLVKMFRANKQVCKSVSFAIVRMIRQVIGSRLTRLIPHVKQFLFIYFNDTVDTPSTIDNENENINYQLFSSREMFLEFSSQHYLEFGNLRRAKFSTMRIIYELTKSSYQCNKCFKPYEIHHHRGRDNTLALCEKCSNHPHQEVHSLDHNQIPLAQQTSITATTQQPSVSLNGNQISDTNCLRCVSLKAGLQIESEKTKYWESKAQYWEKNAKKSEENAKKSEENAKKSEENAKYWEKEAKHERERADGREYELLKLMDNLRKEFNDQLAVLTAKQP
ncbi:unnamed protein product [Didymodactylos carnosus]|uniref:histone acetyltransferase n=1 Tax=Didymodactylos carnosus TaxID=1234261 RepID=A0A8S2CU62_9BILA|nr:unnamed protein product [Didymodactylos carnosus]CAF3516269.1 unnamed protein product [Didymodactylos carnosus]